MGKNDRSMPVLITLATVTLLVVGIYFGKPVLMPLALSVLLSFLLSPIVDALHRLGVGRKTSVIVLVFFFFLIFAAGTYVIGSQISALAYDIPRYKDNIREKLVAMREAGKGSAFERLQQTLKELRGELKESKEASKKAAKQNRETPAQGNEEVEPVPVVVRGNSSSPIWQLPSALGPLLELLATTGLVVVMVIFMLLRKRELRNRFIVLCGYGRMPATTQALDEAGARISRYLLMQTIINATFGAAAGIGLSLIGLPYAMLWGFLAFALRFIPYLGPWLGASLPIMLSLAVFPGWLHPFMVFGLFLILEGVSNMIMEPLLYGQTAGVSEVALIAAVAFWTWVWGAIGLALATPLTVCLVVLAKYVPGLGVIQTMMGDEPVMNPERVFYQRLLAMDANEAEEIAKEFREEHEMPEFCDKLLLPAIIAAKRDLVDDKFSPEHLAFIVETVKKILEKACCHELNTTEIPIPDCEEAGKRPLIIAVPSEDQLDELVMLMLKAIMPGQRVEVLSGAALSGEAMEAISRCHPAAVCLGAILPGGAEELRHLTKRLQAKFNVINIVATRFGMHNAKRIRALSQALGVSVAVTLVEAKNLLLHQLQLEPAEKGVNGRLAPPVPARSPRDPLDSLRQN